MTTTPTVHSLEYRPLIQGVNGLARVAGLCGLPIGKLEEESILAAARRKTGLSDWGDEGFREPLRHILGVVDGAPVTPLARVMLRQSFIHAVANRLRLREWMRRHPELSERRIERPIFVLGFPRTGTTVLQNLLSLDPSRRGLYFWELSNPVPVHEDPTIDIARRRRMAKRILDLAYMLAPEMGEVHHVDVDTVEECWPLFGGSFAVMNWDLQSGLSEVGDHLLQMDMVEPYREYKRHLQVMVDRQPADQLVLKCPEHLFFVDALLEVFPDACIVQTHRDPFATIASYCSLMSMQWRNLYGRIDPKVIGRHMSERLANGVERAMAARQKADPSRFYDVHFDRLVRDPAGVVRDVARHFDLEWRPEMDKSVAAYLGGNGRSDGRGNHRYDASLYGLHRGHVYDRYARYIDSYRVPHKAA